MQKMVHNALSVRKGHVGSILKTLRKISAIQIVSEDDLMQKSHTASSEPFFYETDYKSSVLKEVTLVDHCKRCLVTQTKCQEVHECGLYDITIPVDENGCCILSEPIGLEKDDRPKNWKCSELCKALTDHEIDGIIYIKKCLIKKSGFSFMKLILDFHMVITVYSELVQSHDDNAECVEEKIMGYPIQCAVGNCGSTLRLLRQAAVHHPVIRNFLANIYSAPSSSKNIDQIDIGFC